MTNLCLLEQTIVEEYRKEFNNEYALKVFVECSDAFRRYMYNEINVVTRFNGLYYYNEDNLGIVDDGVVCLKVTKNPMNADAAIEPINEAEQTMITKYIRSILNYEIISSEVKESTIFVVVKYIFE